ncbi:sulfurtransferase [Saccharopolyspora gregorii]|uniref:thiosulfate sulfurtransferase n=1 Tax=Saccharopolyspora gregorii TaxID=33914 RepID=A0ABP6S357_9PSEU
MSRAEVLVSTDWAEQNLNTDKVVFAEVDEDTTAYDGGHIPGAIKLDWRNDLQDHVRRDFVSREGFEKLLSAKGISNDDTVILYGGNNNWFAAYAYWYFKLYGHSDVKLLDGGRKKWELDGRQLVKDEPNRGATSYQAQDPDTSIRAFRDEVVDAIGTKNLVTCAPRRVRGQAGRPRAPAAGVGAARRAHPAGVNVPWSKTANEDGTFKSDDDLKKIYAEAGWTTRRTPSPTAASASAPRTAGSCSASCWGTRT